MIKKIGKRILLGVLASSIFAGPVTAYAVDETEEVIEQEEVTEQPTEETETSTEPTEESQEEAPKEESQEEAPPVRLRNVPVLRSDQIINEILPMLESDDAYITDLAVNYIQDGIGVWDENDEPGNDSSDSNKIVRTFDSVNYSVDYGTQVKTEGRAYENGYIWFEFTLPVSKDKAEFNTDAMGWMSTDEGYQWTITENTDGSQTLKCARKLVTTEGNQSAIPGSGQVYFTVKVKAMKNGDKLIPSLKSYMDHNDEVKSLTFDPVTVSAGLRLNVNMANPSNYNLKDDYDFSTGNANAPNKDAGVVTGRMNLLGITVALYNENPEKKLMGVEMPTGPITFDIDMNSVYKLSKNADNAINLNDTMYSPLVWSASRNSRDQQPDFSQSDERNEIGAQVSYYVPYGRYTGNKTELNLGESTRYVWNSGDWFVTQNGNKLSFTIKDYEINPNWFPNLASEAGQDNNPYYDKDQGVQNNAIFSAGEVYYVLPIGTGDDYINNVYGEGNTEDSTVIIDFTDNNLQATSISGQKLKKVNDNTNQTKQDDDRRTVSLPLIPPGSHHSIIRYTNANGIAVGTDKVANGGFAETGQDALPAGVQNNNSWIGWGVVAKTPDKEKLVSGADSLMKFDPNGIEIDYSTLEGCAHGWFSQIGDAMPIPSSEYSKETHKFYYAAKPDGTIWTSDDEQDKAVITDLVYYDSIESLEAAGKKCVGILYSFRGTPKQVNTSSNNNVWAHVQYKTKSGANVIGKVYQVVQDTTYWIYDDKKNPPLFEDYLNKTITYEQLTAGATQVDQREDYKKAAYDKSGYIPATPEGHWWGDSLLIAGYESKINKTVSQTQNEEAKKFYDLDYGEYIVDYELTPSYVFQENVTWKKATTVTIVDTLPAGMEYIAETSTLGGTYEDGEVTGGKDIDPKVTKNEDGTTTLTYTFKASNLEKEQPKLRFKAQMDSATPTAIVFTNTATINTTEDQRENIVNWGNISSYAITTTKTSDISVTKKTDDVNNEVNAPINWTLSWSNNGATDMENLFMYDFMPRNKDGKSTKMDGTLEVKNIKLIANDTFNPNDYEVWYTTDASVKDLNAIAADDLQSLGWTHAPHKADGNYAINKNVTAWGIVGNLNAGERVEAVMETNPQNNKPGNIYVNRAGVKNAYVNSYAYVANRTIEGTVWEDVNKDGERQEDEPLVKDVTVKVVDKNGNTVTNLSNQACEMTTDENGNYKFINLPEGTYKVVFSGNNIRNYDASPVKAKGVDESVNSDAAPTNGESADGATISDIKLPALGEFKGTYSVEYQDLGLVASFGELKIKKELAGDIREEDRQKEFKITVTLSDKTIEGDFGDLKFDKGVAIVNLKGGQSVSGMIPNGVEYTITEDDYKTFGFASEIKNAAGTITVDGVEATVTNTKTTGNLSISKKLTGWIKEEDTNKEFEYTVTLSNKEISGKYGDLTFTNGVAKVTVSDGKTKTAEKLPTDITYTVVEKDYTSEKYILESKENDTGAITENQTAEAKFTNRVEKYGSLTVKKQVEGALQDEFDNVYSFTVTLSDKTVNGTFGDMTFKDGVATFTLKNGESATARRIPSDITYKVQEEDYRSIGFKTKYERQTGTIPRNNTANTLVTNIREVGDLNLTKVNDGGDKNKEFNFIVRIKNKNFSGTYGDMVFYKGEAKVKIKGGQTIKAFNLPAQTQYEVIEEDYINDGYFTNSENATGTIEAEGVQKPKFTNVYRTGTLNIAKTSNGNDYHKDREFTFKVTITKPDGTFTKNATYGGVNYTTENGNLVTTVKVKEGKSIQLTDIPDTFLYRVEEIEANKDGYVTAVTDNEGVIDNGKTTIVAFTNTRDTFGDLVVSKEGKGEGVLASKVFTIRITLSDKTINGKYGDMDFKDGVATISLKAGESKKATKLPNGITYVVDELNANLYKVSYEGKDGTIKGNSTVSAKVTNEKDLPPIEKKIEGKNHYDLPQRGNVFTYTVTTVVPDGAHDFKVTDTIVDELAFGEKAEVLINDEKADIKTVKRGQEISVTLNKEQIDKEAGKTLTLKFEAVIDSNDLSKYLVGEDIKAPNKAEYLINNAIRKDSNTVTVTPPLPEPPIEKFVNEKKHDDVDYDNAFIYKIVTQIPEDVLEFEINDELESVLEFAKEEAIVKIAGKETKVETSFDGQNIKVLFDEETLKSNRCKEVTVEFEAKIRKDADVLEYLTDDGIIIPNKASYTLNNSFKTNKLTKDSDTVTITPPVTRPEPVKYVNEKEHHDLESYEEEFEYKVQTIIPRGAHKFVLTDEVVDELYIKEDTVKVMVDGTDISDTSEKEASETETPDTEVSDTDIPKTDEEEATDIPETDVSDTEVPKTIRVENNTITITFDREDMGKFFDKELILTFTAGIKEDADVLKYMTEDGILIPNKASYMLNDNPDMTEETNTVTVKPPVTKPEIIKYVNDKEHEDLKTKDEVFTYKIVTKVPRGTDTYILSDVLADEIQLIEDSAKCIIGEEEVEVKVDGQKVYVELDREQLGRLFNKDVTLTFDARLKEGVSGTIPNTASYDVGDGEPVVSNEVTVTPPEEKIMPQEVPQVIKPETTPQSITPSTGIKTYLPIAVTLSAVAAGMIVLLVALRKKR